MSCHSVANDINLLAIFDVDPAFRTRPPLVAVGPYDVLFPGLTFRGHCNNHGSVNSHRGFGIIECVSEIEGDHVVCTQCNTSLDSPFAIIWDAAVTVAIVFEGNPPPPPAHEQMNIPHNQHPLVFG